VAKTTSKWVALILEVPHVDSTEGTLQKRRNGTFMGRTFGRACSTVATAVPFRRRGFSGGSTRSPMSSVRADASAAGTDTSTPLATRVHFPSRYQLPSTSSCTSGSRHHPGGGPNRLARPAPHLRQPPGNKRCPAESDSGADRARDHRSDDALRPPEPDARRDAVNVLDRPTALPCDIRATQADALDNHM